MLGNRLHSRYTIAKFLGIGNSGETYLAADSDLPSRPDCIVKVVKYAPELTTYPPLVREIFEEQAVMLDRAGTHPLVPTLMAKFIEDGAMYFVREYIEGDLLSDEFSYGNQWTQTQVFDFLSDLMDILSHIHGYKYIHGNLHPQNIIRKPNGRFAVIGLGGMKDTERKLKNVPPNLHDRVKIEPIGIPGYTPYEQEQKIVKFGTDLYAVGAIAIQGLTGQFPVDRDPITYELKWQEEVKIDRRLVAIIDRMVRPDYRNRYQSADEAIADLKAFAITQIPRSKFDRLKPHLIFGITSLAFCAGLTTLRPQVENRQVKSNPVVSNVISEPNKSTWQVYRDKQQKFRIKYYPTWQIDSVNNLLSGEAIGLVSPLQDKGDRFRERISVRTENLSDPNINLDSYTKSAIAEISRFYRNAKIIESTRSQLTRQPANIIVYTGTNDRGIEVKNLEIWTVANGIAHIITYQAEPDRYYSFLQTAMTTINSFEIDRSGD
jgi:eukaryotic-like serine/threonine-protein kinase